VSASLAWAENKLTQQPENVRHAYQQAALEIVRVLNQPIYATTISIPYDNRHLVVRVGTVLHQVFRKTCSPVLMQKLHALTSHPQQEIRESVQLTCYLAGQQILFLLPDEQVMQEQYTGFDRQGNLLVSDLHSAETIVESLARFMHLLRQIVSLHPAWETDERYSEKHALIATHLINQGRALADYHTQKIIHDIMTAWKSGEMTRGLTIFLPYLNERHYQMEDYKIVVIPPGRILFRPEFVVGACRITERHVRSDSNLSQATRWQLLSQLDTIIQAFENASSG
jgi:hypothetical protein